MNHLAKLDLNLLRVLHALLTEQHVSRAAERLHRSQPAVSHALAQLRARFDDPLLLRVGNQLQLTPRAKALLPPLEAALRQLDDLLGPEAFDPAALRRDFWLSLSDFGAHLLLPELMQRLRQEAPGVTLHLLQSHSRQAMLGQLLEGEVDVALGVFPSLPEPLQATVLFQDGFVCVADGASLSAAEQAQGLALEAWLARPHVSVMMRHSEQDELERALAVIGQRRTVALSLPYWGLATEALRGTDLVLTVLAQTLRLLPPASGLSVFPAPLPIPELTFSLAWHPRRHLDPAQRWLRALIVAIVHDKTPTAAAVGVEGLLNA
ncbi:MAG: LysR family transcriptional regulator [Neisseriaceae bacterium]|nr:LysR family transcriptional regulator [Neisseriaceae bacterium]MBP6862152.1 LysR family transcriptional regulator [Neisseriaceae bacterium]